MFPACPLVLALLLGFGFARLSDAQFADVPSSSDPSAHILDLIHDYAGQYVSSLPNFTCDQVTEQYQAGKKGTHWKQLDSYTSKLVFADGSEQRSLEDVNGHPVRAGSHRAVRRPLTTEGEFAVLISNVFGEASQASFEWQGWQQLRSRRVAVFRYSIDHDHSTIKLSLPAFASAIVPYHGLVFANSETGMILRIENQLTDIPWELQTKSLVTTIDYTPINIGAGSYILPSDAVVEAVTPSGKIRNDLHFRNYRKFEAESTIVFGTETPGTPKSSATLPP